jgi:hypothetical protein
VRGLLLSVALIGCGPAPPTIRMLQYSPNAGFVNEDNKISGTVLYADADQDVSQGVIEVSYPDNQLVFRSEPIPVTGVAGIQGTATFSLELKAVEVNKTGIYHFSVWIVDLLALESNHLTGDFRIATRDPYDNKNNP